jgi:hypothetical protein
MGDTGQSRVEKQPVAERERSKRKAAKEDKKWPEQETNSSTP